MPIRRISIRCLRSRPDGSFVEYMGGGEAILGRARADFERGEFRFVAQALSHLVFAEPGNQDARGLLADTFEQLGYLAESATWRNAYLFGAQELRQGMAKLPARPALPLETVAALRTAQVWDVLGVRLNGKRAEGRSVVINWVFEDTGEIFAMTLENCALTCVANTQVAAADATFRLARPVLDRIVAKETAFADAVQRGLIAVAGDTARSRR